MNKPEKKRLYREAIKKWGVNSQLFMLIEESAELIQASNKVIRNGTEDKQSIENLANELADVEIMIEQFKEGLNWTGLKEKVEFVKYCKLLKLKKLVFK